MLSYRHAFHAGNHADVLKHALLVQLARQLTRKDTPLLFVDTHAGAGGYVLTEGFAAQNAEFANGIGKLWSRADLPDPITDYVAQIKALNPDGVLRFYPGSPQIALALLRPQDRLRLYELHGTDVRLLQEHFAHSGRRVGITAGDGLAGMRAVLPPPARRALVLIDPSYEVGADYRVIATAMREALHRFATGTYAVWYPLLSRREALQLPIQLTRLAGSDWLNVSLRVKAPAVDGFGLHGSGMFIFNPPWQFVDAVRAIMPVLVEALGQDAHAGYDLDFRES